MFNIYNANQLIIYTEVIIKINKSAIAYSRYK